MTLSIPPEIAEDYEKIAGREAKSRSQLFRDMFLLYKERASQKEYFELQRYGSRKARGKRNLTARDLEKIVFEDR